jgi:hypothetical protein
MQINYRRRWIIQATLGLIINSSGLCMTIESGFWKAQGATTLQWVVAGTVSLIVFNAGLCLLIDALKYNLWHNKKI